MITKEELEHAINTYQNSKPCLLVNEKTRKELMIRNPEINNYYNIIVYEFIKDGNVCVVNTTK